MTSSKGVFVTAWVQKRFVSVNLGLYNDNILPRSVSMIPMCSAEGIFVSQGRYYDVLQIGVTMTACAQKNLVR